MEAAGIKQTTEKIKETIKDYERLLDIIGSEIGAECNYSKSEIARKYGKPYTGTLKKLSFLERYGLIVRPSAGICGRIRHL